MPLIQKLIRARILMKIIYVLQMQLVVAIWLEWPDEYIHYSYIICHTLYKLCLPLVWTISQWDGFLIIKNATDPEVN